jgi:hypothetical protein
MGVQSLKGKRELQPGSILGAVSSRWGAASAARASHAMRRISADQAWHLGVSPMTRISTRHAYPHLRNANL